MREARGNVRVDEAGRREQSAIGADREKEKERENKRSAKKPFEIITALVHLY